MSMSSKLSFAIVLAVSSFLTAAPAAIFDSVPASSLFVVRIHNMEYTLGSVDQFLTGLSPMPIAVSMMGRMQIANALGDANMTGIDFRSDFVIFGIADQGAKSKNPKLIIAGILPVADYDKLLAENKSASKPDANGISTIGPKKYFITKAVGDYALFAPCQSYADTLSLSKAIKDSSLASKIKSRLPDDTSSIWAWADIKNVMNIYGDQFRSGLDKAQSAATDPNNPQTKTMAPLITAYFNIVKAIAAQTNDISLSANFKADMISLHKTVTPIPDSNFAKLLAIAKPSNVKGHQLLAYMPADSFMTVAYNIDKPFTIKSYEMLLDTFAPAFGPNFTPKMRPDIMDFTRKSIQSLGDSLAFAVNPSEKSTPPFNYTYVLQVSNEQQFRDAVEQGVEMAKVPVWQQFFKNVGMNIDYSMQKSARTYKDIPVDLMTVKMIATDPNSAQAKIMMQFYGSQFIQSFAMVNGLALLTGGADVNESTNNLIDLAKSKTAKIPQGLSASLALLPDANDHQFVGTYNYLRLMKMIVLISPQLPFPADIVKKVKSSSDIAFAGDISKAQMDGYVVIPKQHLMEIKSAFEMVMQQQKQKQQTAPITPDGNSPPTPKPE